MLFECCSKATCILLFDFSKIMTMHIKYLLFVQLGSKCKKRRNTQLRMSCVTKLLSPTTVGN